MNVRLFLLALGAVILLYSCSNESKDEFHEVPDLGTDNYFESEAPSTSFKASLKLKENSDKIAALGRVLFYDNRLSKNGSISCSSCHHQSQAFAENKKFSKGLFGELTQRNSMSLVNTSVHRFLFWQGHSGYEENILNPVTNHIELGMRSNTELINKLNESPKYVEHFQEVFGQDISEENIAEALATFVGSIVSYKSKFDLGWEDGFSNFSALELMGKELFNNEASCASCHAGVNHTAIWRSGANIGLDMIYEDQGAGGGSFKIPTLRNIELTAPYMHDGRFETLEEVVDHYSHGIQDHPNLDWVLSAPGKNFTQLEKDALVAYMKTLTDYSIVTDQKFSNPF